MFRHGQHWSVLMPMIEMDIEAWLILYLKKYQFCYRMMSIGNNEIKNKVDYTFP